MSAINFVECQKEVILFTSQPLYLRRYVYIITENMAYCGVFKGWKNWD